MLKTIRQKLCFAMILAGLSAGAVAPTWALDAATIKAQQAIVVDYETGNILLSKNENDRMPTSSMSKVLTMYVVFKAMKNGQLQMDQTLPVSENAWRMQGSKMFVTLGSQVPVQDLIRGVIVQSGNDATIVLAEGLAGSEQAFASLMNDEAKRLGMQNSHFMNASGWPDENHYSTAKDLAKLGWGIIHDFPDLYQIYSEKEYTYNNIKQGNRNPLLYANVGGDGIKTGHTEAAGYGLIGSGKGPDGRRVVFVVNGYASMNDRFEETPRILDWALKNFTNQRVFTAGKPLTDARVVFGHTEKVSLSVASDLVMTLPRFQTGKVKMTATYKSPLVAPLKAGQEVGVVTLDAPGLPSRKVPLIVTQDVDQQNIFSRAIAKVMVRFVGL
ncbi:MAG: D-alanyl-D-alanine carboxypeptidase family protein [Pseudomonadota bacterium]